MADNLTVKDGVGAGQTLATTDVSGVHYPKHKLSDGTNDVKTGAAANVDDLSSNNAALVSPPGQWTVTHAPAANTQATASKAAGGAGVRHVCTAIHARVVGGTTAPAAALATVHLRDGATGAGTPLATFSLSLAAAVAAKDEIVLSGLNIVGSANTAMTLEFAAAAGANTLESVTLIGHSCS